RHHVMLGRTVDPKRTFAVDSGVHSGRFSDRYACVWLVTGLSIGLIRIRLKSDLRGSATGHRPRWPTSDGAIASGIPRPVRGGLVGLVPWLARFDSGTRS